MKKAEPAESAAARRDGWARHEAEQRRAWLDLTPAQRLAWLEQAKRFCVQALGAAQGGGGCARELEAPLDWPHWLP